MKIKHVIAVATICSVLCCLAAISGLGATSSFLSDKWESAYDANPFSFLSRDYFSRFGRDMDARPLKNEVMIDSTWKIILPGQPDEITRLMAGDLSQFLTSRMLESVRLCGSAESGGVTEIRAGKCIVLTRDAGGLQRSGSFSIKVTKDSVILHGADSAGLRDGVVKLVDLIGLRQSPILPIGENVYTPRIGLRLGAKQLHGSYRDVLFMGNNAAVIGEANLYAISPSDAIPELAKCRQLGLLEDFKKEVSEARRYGLRTYIAVSTKLLAKDAPVFVTHPEIRGAEINFGNRNTYTLCSEDPLVKRYLAESVEDLLRSTGADGILILVGGEGFFHCYMRPWDAQKGHTSCSRCEALGAERVVADLCNTMGAAARKVNPHDEVVAWPYSASAFWSADDSQLGMIKLMKPGTALLTEPEKDEVIQKPQGVRKLLWDYSIDMTGVANRALTQIKACKSSGIPVYLKSDSEHAYEAPRLPNIPCMDRWLARADALAASGADGAWVFPWFYRPYYGTSSGEIGKYMWWDEVTVVPTSGQHIGITIDKEKLLQSFAARIAGKRAGPHLRNAWRFASDAIDFSPEIAPRYFMGTYSLGPDHPMCADPDAAVPSVFYLRGSVVYDPKSEVSAVPTFDKQPAHPGPVFGGYYRSMEACLRRAVDEMQAASGVVPERCRETFDAEDVVIRFFYHTERTQANFYESCSLRDRLLELAKEGRLTISKRAEARKLYSRWRTVLLDELDNAVSALPIEEKDNRLDQMTPIFPAGIEANRAKQELLRRELSTFLPSLAERLGIVDSNAE